MARAEVHRMDSAAAHARSERHRGNCGHNAEVLNQEIEDLKKQLRATESEKADLVESVRRMMAKNSTQIFQKQAEKAQERNLALEMSCRDGREALEQQKKVAEDKTETCNQLAHQLQEDKTELGQKLQAAFGNAASLQAALDKSASDNKGLAYDKAHLVATMQALMRENTKFKSSLAKERILQEKEVQQLTADKTMLAKLRKKARDRTSGKPAKKGVEPLRMHHTHGTPAQRAAQKAHMKEIDKYIDRYDESGDADDVSEQQMSAMQRQTDLMKKGKVGAHLSDWLGFKTAEVEKPVQKTTPQKAAADDSGDDEAESLVRQAEADLANMKNEGDGS